jgi:hypothetical protein
MSLYGDLPTEMLADFHFEIYRNIQKGVLSYAMFYELDLIAPAAEKRGLSLEQLKKLKTPWKIKSTKIDSSREKEPAAKKRKIIGYVIVDNNCFKAKI